EPRPLCELGLELTGRPTRVTREDAQRFEGRADAERIVGEVDRPQVAENLDEALELDVTASGERDDGVGRYGTTGEDDPGRGHELVPFGEHVVDSRFTAAIQDDAEAAIVSVLEHQHDGPVEVGIDEGWCRDEQPSAVRWLLGHDPILARGR